MNSGNGQISQHKSIDSKSECTGRVIMNRCQRSFLVLNFLCAVLNPAWAICEAEISQANSLVREAYHVDASQWRTAFKYMSKQDIERAISSNQEEIDKNSGYSDGNSRLRVARLRINICFAKAAMADKSSSIDTVDRQRDNQSAVQQQIQPAQQQASQAQQLAQQNQARADQARHGKRRRHEPENEASQCIQPDFGGLYGGMKNTCNFKVWYTYCGYRPKENSWLTGMNCEKQSFGSDSVGPGRTSAAHTKGVELLYWIACKEPAWTVDTEFVPGQGLRGRCHTVGGN
jgi:hypothetical protein